MGVTRKNETVVERSNRIQVRTRRRVKRKKMRVLRKSETTQEFRTRIKKIETKTEKKRKWYLQRSNETTTQWETRISKRKTLRRRRRVKRLTSDVSFSKETAQQTFTQTSTTETDINLGGSTTTVIKSTIFEDLSSGSSDSDESDLEVDTDDDICSNSDDESEGMDITDPSITEEKREWRKTVRKTRSERRRQLVVTRKNETVVERSNRI